MTHHTLSSNGVQSGIRGDTYLGCRLVGWYDEGHFTGVGVAKWFDGKLYIGMVESDTFIYEGHVRKQLWHIRYTDNDEEDMDWEELWTCIVVFEINSTGRKIGGNYIGKHVAKWFEGVLHFGMVTSLVAAVGDDDTPLWRIKYDDKDEEDFNEDELQAGLTMWQYETQGKWTGPSDPPSHPGDE